MIKVQLFMPGQTKPIEYVCASYEFHGNRTFSLTYSNGDLEYFDLEKLFSVKILK